MYFPLMSNTSLNSICGKENLKSLALVLWVYSPGQRAQSVILQHDSYGVSYSPAQFTFHFVFNEGLTLLCLSTFKLLRNKQDVAFF